MKFKLLLKFLQLALFSYLIVLLTFCLLQRKLIFAPSKIKLPLPNRLGVPIEEVKIATLDQLSLAGWWIAQPNSKQAPTLLYCHGNGGNLTHYSHVAKIFFDYGWNVLLFDYRGYGESSSASPSEEGLALDSEAAYDWIRGQGFTDAGIFVWGQSLGAAVAARLAASRKPAALILENAFTNLYDEARAAYPWLLVFPWMIKDKFESAKYVAERKMPLLVISAEEDKVIPPRLVKNLFEMASEPKSFISVPGIGHNDFPSVHHHYTAQIIAFVSSTVRSE